MPKSIRSSVLTLLVAGSFVLAQAGARAHAQAPKPKAAAPAPAAAAPAAKAAAPARPANLDQVLATVNGEKITRADLIRFLSSYPLPPLSHELIYHDAIETLINTVLVEQYLERQKIPVPPEKMNEAMAQFERDVRADGRDLQTALQENGQTVDDLRRELTNRLLWIEFVKLKATDAELRRFALSHKELINGTQVKASHIYLKVAPEATPADKEKVRQKLLAIKKDIDDKKITFAEAANKYSEDPGNSEGSGGDIDYFSLSQGVVEEFANAAMGMKLGEISDPVETVHGFHLIQVTDRKEGKPVDFEQQRTFILQVYSADIQKQILTAERKRAEENHSIDVKPMPADLFPPSTPAQATPGGAATTPAPAATTPEASKVGVPK